MSNSLRILTVEYEMVKPLPALDFHQSQLFKDKTASLVPVIRVFGRTADSVSCCAHVHRVLPYLCVPLTESDASGVPETVALQLGASLDRSLALCGSAIGRQVAGQSSKSAAVFVHSVLVVSGRSIYGYHDDECLFLKIHLFDPRSVAKAAELLQSGVVLHRCFQPYEAHVPYIQQFFIDFNLFGMNYMKMDKFTIRQRCGDALGQSPRLEAVTTCRLEVDVDAADIANRRLLGEFGMVQNPGLDEIWSRERDRGELSQFERTIIPETQRSSQKPVFADETAMLAKLASQLHTTLATTDARSPSSLEEYGNRYPPASWPSLIDQWQPPVSKLSSLQDLSPQEVSGSGERVYVEGVGSGDDVWSTAEVDFDHALLTQLSQQSAASNVSMDLSLEGALLDLIEDGAIEFDHVSPEILQQDEEEELEMSQVIDSQLDVVIQERDIEEKSDRAEATCDPTIGPGSSSTVQQQSLSTSTSDQHSSSSDLFTFDGTRDEKERGSSDGGATNTHTQSSVQLTADETRYGGISGRGDVWAEFPNPPSISSSELLDTPTSESASVFSSCGLQHWRTLAVVSALSARGRDSAIQPVLAALSDSGSAAGDHYWSSRCRHMSLLSLPPSTRDINEWLLKRRRQRRERTQQNRHHKLSVVENRTGNSDTTLQPSPSLSDCCRYSDRNSVSSSSPDSLRSLDLDTDPDIRAAAFPKQDTPVLTPSMQSTTPSISMSTDRKFLASTPLTCRKGRMGRSCRKKVVASSSQLFPEAVGTGGSPISRPSTPDVAGCSAMITKSVTSQKEQHYSDPLKNRIDATAEPEDSQQERLLGPSVEIGDSFGESPITPSLARTPLGLRVESPANLTVKYGFEPGTQANQDLHLSQQHRSMTLMCVEVLAMSRDRLCPDPQFDSIAAVFFSVIDHMPRPVQSSASSAGCVATSGVVHYTPPPTVCTGWSLTVVSDELELLDTLAVLVQQFDPDIISGWEIERQSLSYLFERAAVLDHCVAFALSRVPRTGPPVPPKGDSPSPKAKSGAKRSFLGSQPWLRGGQVFIRGRIVLNLWRVVKDEVALYDYTLENVVFHVLKRRIPHYEPHTLTGWWSSGQPFLRWRVLDYFRDRCQACLDVLGRLDLIARTSELARIFGIQFLEVLSRGTQFRVESMMLRLARQRHLVAVSPSIQQRATSRAPECIPLVMEPDSRYYDDPVVVLDFQSLYPSIIIAYNYCFTTCLGRVDQLGQCSAFPFGCTWLDVPVRVAADLLSRQCVHVSPCGVAFVSRHQRTGLLPDMLSDILATRIMVKAAMKKECSDSPMWQQLNFKQLGLKLIANVTYGYTSANFSGRMPCIEVGDSVVSKGRETLERAIRTIESHHQWRAKVVYGDTDSLFVLLKGRSRAEAFRLGREMVDVVTADNPPPVKLKFEKVFQPCILQTKKRYVGFMYESEDQAQPVFDAKGIETVRRDGCPFVARTMQRSLRVLFESGSLESVRRYVSRQLWRLQCGRLSVADLVFAREFRGRAGYRPRARLPALLIANRLSSADARSEPLAGSRVPYVVVYGAPGSPLLQLVRTPAELAADPSLRLNVEYYVCRALAPALSRCLSLLSLGSSADPLLWWKQLPRTPASATSSSAELPAVSSLHRFVSAAVCCVCGMASAMSGTSLCRSCSGRPQFAVHQVVTRLRQSQRALCRLGEVCAACIGGPLGRPDDDVTVSGDRSLTSMLTECENLLCPTFWSSLSAAVKLKQTQSHYRRVSDTLRH